jgi:hypothetical protein
MLAASPAPAAAGTIAGFDVAPASPRVGDPVQLVSSSCDPEDAVWSEDWDLNGDGTSDDATGPTASVTFASPGAHLVGLRVMTASGSVTTVWHTVVVAPADAAAPPPLPPLISPFPVVSLGGRLADGKTRVNFFSVQAPVCSSVSVTCTGRGCPFKATTALVGHRALRLRGVERRFRAGDRVTVAVSRGGLVGKLTEFRMRREKPPLRTDKCVLPGASIGSKCPGG